VKVAPDVFDAITGEVPEGTAAVADRGYDTDPCEVGLTTAVQVDPKCPVNQRIGEFRGRLPARGAKRDGWLRSPYRSPQIGEIARPFRDREIA
jgi:hypothetical protein